MGSRGNRNFKTRSKIETDLPHEIQDQLNENMLRGMTYEDTSAWLKSLGYDISRACVGRYGLRFFKFRQNTMQMRSQVQSLVGEDGEAMDVDEAITLGIQQQILAELIDGTVDAIKQPGFLGEVAKLQTAAINREKIRQDILAKTEAAANSVEKLAKTGGLTEDTVKEIRSKILGIAE